MRNVLHYTVISLELWVNDTGRNSLTELKVHAIAISFSANCSIETYRVSVAIYIEIIIRM
jgi:hypothetical protein